MGKIVEFLSAHTGQGFSFYKSGTVYRRVERRMIIHQLRNIDAYIEYLNGNPQGI